MDVGTSTCALLKKGPLKKSPKRGTLEFPHKPTRLCARSSPSFPPPPPLGSSSLSSLISLSPYYFPLLFVVVFVVDRCAFV